MNRLAGKISKVESNGELSLVEVRIDGSGDVLVSVVLDTTESAPHLHVGNSVSVLFKETEVILAAGDPGPISLRNRLKCRVLGRDAGALLTHFRLDYHGMVLHSLITTGSAEFLALRDGDGVMALVKTTEVSLGRGPV